MSIVKTYTRNALLISCCALSLSACKKQHHTTQHQTDTYTLTASIALKQPASLTEKLSNLALGSTSIKVPVTVITNNLSNHAQQTHKLAIAVNPDQHTPANAPDITSTNLNSYTATVAQPSLSTGTETCITYTPSLSGTEKGPHTSAQFVYNCTSTAHTIKEDRVVELVLDSGQPTSPSLSLEPVYITFQGQQSQTDSVRSNINQAGTPVNLTGFTHGETYTFTPPDTITSQDKRTTYTLVTTGQQTLNENNTKTPYVIHYTKKQAPTTPQTFTVTFTSDAPLSPDATLTLKSKSESASATPTCTQNTTKANEFNCTIAPALKAEQVYTPSLSPMPEGYSMPAETSIDVNPDKPQDSTITLEKNPSPTRTITVNYTDPAGSSGLVSSVTLTAEKPSETASDVSCTKPSTGNDSFKCTDALTSIGYTVNTKLIDPSKYTAGNGSVKAATNPSTVSINISTKNPPAKTTRTITLTYKNPEGVDGQLVTNVTGCDTKSSTAKIANYQETFTLSNANTDSCPLTATLKAGYSVANSVVNVPQDEKDTKLDPIQITSAPAQGIPFNNNDSTVVEFYDNNGNPSRIQPQSYTITLSPKGSSADVEKIITVDDQYTTKSINLMPGIDYAVSIKVSGDYTPWAAKANSTGGKAAPPSSDKTSTQQLTVQNGDKGLLFEFKNTTPKPSSNTGPWNFMVKPATPGINAWVITGTLDVGQLTKNQITSGITKTVNSGWYACAWGSSMDEWSTIKSDCQQPTQCANNSTVTITSEKDAQGGYPGTVNFSCAS